MALPPPGQRPRHAHDHFPLAEAPEINPHADYVVDPRVGGLVQQERGEGAERVDEEAGFDAAVHGCQALCYDAGRSWRGGGGGGVCVFVFVVLGCCCCWCSYGGGGDFLGGVVVGCCGEVCLVVVVVEMVVVVV